MAALAGPEDQPKLVNKIDFGQVNGKANFEKKIILQIEIIYGLYGYHYEGNLLSLSFISKYLSFNA